MDDRVRELVEATIQTIVGLDVALFFQENPSTFDTADGVALRTHRHVADVRPACERLAARGLLDKYERGDGRYTCYGLAAGREVWNLLCLLSEAYIDDPEARKEIVRMLIKRQREERSTAAASNRKGGLTGD